MKRKETKRGTLRSDAGIAIIYVALFLLSSLWFVSLAIDMGKLMATRTELQNAADAAALAGASAINPETGEIDQDEARARAATAASRNRAFEQVPTPVTINPAVDVDFPAGEYPRVRVRVHRTRDTGNPMITHFAQTVGLASLNVTADATGEARPLRVVCEGLVPFAPQELPGGADFNTDCASEYVLRTSAGEGQQGNYQLLRFPDCNEDEFNGGGGAAIREYVAHGYGCCEELGKIMMVETKTGVTVGPFRQGLLDRWNQDTNQNENICYEQYINGSPKGNGRRVVLTPIINTFDVNGTKYVEIKRFAAFFLKRRPIGGGLNMDLYGQFIKYVAPGEFGTGEIDSGIYGIHLVE